MNNKQIVVSIDDNRLNLMLVESMLAGMDVEIVSFIKPLDALDFCGKKSVDLLLIDYMMPDLDGISFIKKVRKLDQDIPTVMITAVDDDDDIKLSALEAGATEFLYKPLRLYEFQARVKNLLNLRKNQLLLKDRAAHLQKEVERATRDILQREIDTLTILGHASEFKDTETGAHISRVALYAKVIGQGLLNEDELATLFFSTPLHDVGKIGIPDSILLKPGKLTKEEFEIMKSHTTVGHELLSSSESKFLKAGALIARSHHEKWDGSGYPDGLKGKDIPLFGRIVAICDVFDALISVRPYKEPWDFDDAVEYINSNSGVMFDQELVALFNENIDVIREIVEEYSD